MNHLSKNKEVSHLNFLFKIFSQQMHFAFIFSIFVLLEEESDIPQ